MAQVNDPEQLNRKKSVNESLLRMIKVKSELEAQHTDSENDDDDYDDHDVLSQAPRPQRFFQDLDNSLEGCAREIFISELLRLCQNDYMKINDYRERLAERAKGFPECPDSRLVNRRNSPNATRERKCATDCYILYAFVNGERTKEINEVFSYQHSVKTETPDADYEAYHIDLTDELVKPDIFAMLSQMQGQLTEISLKQRSDSHLLEDLRSDVTKMSLSFRTFHGTLNSILTRMAENGSVTQVQQIQSDVSKLSSTISVMNKRFLDNPPEQKTANRLETDTIKAAEANTKKTYAEIVDLTRNANTGPTGADKTSTARTRTETAPTTAALQDNVSVTATPRADASKNATKVQKSNERNQKTNTHHSSPKRPDKSTRESLQEPSQTNPTHRPQRHEPSGGKFIAARRRKITSYFIGNIDVSVSESDIRDYLEENGIKPTHMTMFYGKNGSSARVNVHFEDEYRVESDEFWPEGVICRRWVSKAEWENERDSRMTKRTNNYRQRYHRYRQNNRDSDYHNDRYDYNDYNDHTKSEWPSGTYDKYERNYWQREELEW